jgi:hypothetical protein
MNTMFHYLVVVRPDRFVRWNWSGNPVASGDNTAVDAIRGIVRPGSTKKIKMD